MVMRTSHTVPRHHFSTQARRRWSILALCVAAAPASLAAQSTGAAPAGAPPSATAPAPAAPAAPRTIHLAAPEMTGFFSGKWACDGAFANGKPISATMEFAEVAGGGWLSAVHDDVP